MRSNCIPPQNCPAGAALFRYRERLAERIEASLGRVETILALTPGPDHASSYSSLKPASTENLCN
jgi:hypothetical protein